MKRRRFFWLFLVIAVIVGATIIDKNKNWKQLFSTTDSRYTDLNTALAPDKAQGWEVSIQPKQKGPYRRLYEGSVLGADPTASNIYRVQDAHRNVVEELNLQGVEGFVQMVVYLETPGGQQTLVVLKRAVPHQNKPNTP